MAKALSKDYCCLGFEATVYRPDDDNLEALILYDSSTRTYSINGNPPWVIKYCPYCGKRLPEDLYDRKYETIKQELGNDYLPDELGNFPKKNVPEEFQTDEWWKKRGL